MRKTFVEEKGYTRTELESILQEFQKLSDEIKKENQLKNELEDQLQCIINRKIQMEKRLNILQDKIQ